MDMMDRRILRLLQEDASLTTGDIAERVGLSPSPCWRRIKQLRESGAIRRSVTLLDPKIVGFSVMVMASVRLSRHSRENIDAFERKVNELDEILECHAMSGERDFVLRIAAPDIDSYHLFVRERLIHLPYIASINSSFMLKQVKHTTALPIPEN
ncbi:MAG: Lrp/AsnC family transcriptional regulator [Rhodospirillaceae bacterium]|jgi:Lrp/AsnC family transcriptional regulator|nr:Lrp/AsnC family transcriptional regulator [Rhodospirillaceae bacterium]MBT7292121.1 Lrp/AsnC family transcriptional regulator [Rhodospirillaceae bacterium]